MFRLDTWFSLTWAQNWDEGTYNDVVQIVTDLGELAKEANDDFYNDDGSYPGSEDEVRDKPSEANSFPSKQLCLFS